MQIQKEFVFGKAESEENYAKIKFLYRKIYLEFFEVKT